jgi:hypothetical protein
MSRNYWTWKLLTAVASVAMLAGFSLVMFGQENPQPQVPMIEDWSTHHLVFSDPGNFAQATQTRPFLEWYKVLNDPRYQMEMARRNADRTRPAGGASGAATSDYNDSLQADRRGPHAPGPPEPPEPPAPPGAEKTKPAGDWNIYLGGASGAGIGATMYPAKYTWNINAAPSCTSDFLVVPVNQAPANQANATGSIVIHSAPAADDTVTIGSTIYGWQTAEGNCSTASYKCVDIGATTTNDATNLAAAINGTCFTGTTCSADPAVTASSSTATVTLTPIAAGALGNVALATSDAAAIYLNGTSQASSALTGGKDGQASIIAFNNLYSGGGAAASQTGTVSANSGSTGQTVTIGSLTLTAEADAQATGKITIVGTVTNAEDVYVDIGTTGTSNESDIYAFHDRIGDCGAAANCVLIGASTTATATNLAAAINGSCLNTCPPSTNVTATSSSNVVTLTAIVAGPAGNNIALSANNTTGGNVTVSGSTLTGGGTATLTSTEFAITGVTTTQLAANIATAINANSSTAGVTATSSGAVITVTATTGGLGSAGPPETGNYITVTSSLTGFTWGSGTLAGGTAPGLCGTGQPTVMWAYNASTAGTGSPMLGSPILSLDGTKVAFIESATTGAILHVLNWRSGDGATSLGASPVAPSTLSTSAACGTTPSCMFSVGLGTNNNTNSPPFYNYATDVLYVGDNGGKLWKVTGVFNGTPTTAAAPWINGVTVDSGYVLTGPVYDPSTGNIFVGDSNGRLSFVPDSTGVLSTTNISGLGAITDPPMVDPSTGHVFVFSGGNGTSAIVEEAGNSALASPTNVNIGNNSAATHVHLGMFDNLYFTSVSTGHLYVCGKQSGNAAPALYSISFNSSGVMTTPVSGPLDLSTTTTAQECSPLSEVFNPNEGSGGTDWLFVGVPASCAFGGSATGCIMSFNITSGTFPTTVSATAAENGGTSGIVVDNVSTSVQASSAYFTTLTSPGGGGCTGEPASDSTNCLVKRTQSGLQ